MEREKTKPNFKRLLKASTKEKEKEKEKVKVSPLNSKKDDKPVNKGFLSIKKMQEEDPTYNQFSVLSNLN